VEGQKRLFHDRWRRGQRATVSKGTKCQTVETEWAERMVAARLEETTRHVGETDGDGGGGGAEDGAGEKTGLYGEKTGEK
jgi:hypothetical protein